MTQTVRNILRGAGVSACTMALYAIALGCFNALMLLIVSMEEGSQRITDLAVPLTKAVILLSQGVGLNYGALHLTLLPLGLTMLLIGLIRALSDRLNTSLEGLCAGLLLWVMVNAWLVNTSGIGVNDYFAVALAKAALVFLLGYCWVLIPQQGWSESLRQLWDKITNPRIRLILSSALRAFVIILVLLLITACITVIGWIWANYAAVIKVADTLGMATGSLVLTTLACLIWLPNMMLWALSWLCGGGFVIGDSSQFSLWQGQGSALPAIPVFGILPNGLQDETIRIVVMLVPAFFALLVGFWLLLSRRRFDVLERGSEERTSFLSLSTVWRYAQPAIVMCICCVVLSIALPILFALSNGSLGEGRLVHLGVDLAVSTRIVERPIVLGFAAAWLMLVVVEAIRFGFSQLVDWARQRFGPSRSGKGSGNTAAAPSGNAKNKTQKSPASPTSGQTRNPVQSRTGSTVGDDAKSDATNGFPGKRRPRKVHSSEGTFSKEDS